MTEKKGTELTTALANDKALGEIFVNSGFFSDATDRDKAIVKILAGREAGLQPIESMTSIHIIKGKITFGSNMMAAAVKKSPNYDYRVKKHTAKECVIDFFENGKLAGTSEFTMDDAKRAGLQTNSGSWYKYPKAMLFARAMSAGVRYYCPDVFGHAPVYVPEELGAEVDGEGEVIDITQAKPAMGYYDVGGNDHAYDPPSEPKTPTKQPKVIKQESKKERKAEVEEFDEESKTGTEPDKDGKVGMEETESEAGEAKQIIPASVIDGIEKPRDALDKIMEYAMKHEKGKVVRPVIIEHYKAWETGEPGLINIPETNIIKMVEELTGIKMKKKEKSHKCDCGKRITEAEFDQQDGYCLKCWNDMQQDG